MRFGRENQILHESQIARMKDVESAIQAVKDDLISKLPKQPRKGSVSTKKLEVSVLPVTEETLAVA